MPLAIWLMASRSRRDRIIGAICAIGCLLGVYASGSRGGSVCIVFAALATVVFDPRFHKHLGVVVFGLAVLGVVAFVAVPHVGQHILDAVRLTGGNHTADSNSVRAEVYKQGIQDVHHSPIDGVGLQVAAEATNVYIQELASGGLLLFLSMQVFTVGGLWVSYRLRPKYDITHALLASLLAAAILNYFEADLTDRFFYVPAALVVALAAIEAEKQRRAPGVDLPSPRESTDFPILLTR
jgi:O-antigen ligase